MDTSRTLISKFFLSGVLSLTAASKALAQTTTTGMVLVGTPTGLSYYDPGTPASGSVAATSPTIFGGSAGAGGQCASPVATSTCDSCAGGTTLASCNPTSVHANLILSVTLQSSTAETFQGTPELLWRFTSEATGTTHAVENSPTLVAGQAFTAEIKWGDLCAVAGGDANCTTDINATRTLTIGIDKDNDDTLDEKVDFNFAFRYVDPMGTSRLTASCLPGTTGAVASEGICDYTVARGDEKIYITDYATAGNDLATANGAVDYNRIAMFYVVDAGTGTTAINTSSSRLILDLKNNSPSEPSISDQRLTGLQNGVKYCFALGNMDQAGNITYFPVQAELENAANDSKYCATPDQVVGLLDDKSCFIATATFGSVMAPEVQTFRQFRNKFLLSNTFGKALVRAYYKVGPEAAEWISHSEFLRTLSLWVLWPLLLFVKLCLALGFWPASLIALGSIVVLKKSTSLWWQRRSALKGEA